MLANIFEKKPIKVDIFTEISDTKPAQTVVFGEIHGDLDIFEQVEIKSVILQIYPDDNLRLFKEKLYLATNRYPSEQFIYNDDFLDGVELNEQPVYLRDLNFDEKVDGFYVFKNIYNSWKSLKISNVEYLPITEFLIEHPKCFQINCYMMPDPSGIQTENRDLIYRSNMVLFPAMHHDAYFDRGRFPLLFPDHGAVLANVSRETELYHKIYETFRHPEQLKDYNIDLLRGENNNRARLKFAIRNIEVVVQKRGTPHLSNIFAIMNTSPQIPIIHCYTNKPEYARFYNGFEHLYNPANHDVRYPNIIFYTYVDNYLVLFELQNTGVIIARFTNRTENLDFHVCKKIIDKCFAVLNRELNALKITSFVGETMEFYNVLYIDAQINYVDMIDIDFYNNVLQNANFPGILEAQQNAPNKFKWCKNVVVNYASDNQYSYLSDETPDVFRTSPVEINNKFTELHFNIKQFTEQNFNTFLMYIIYILKTYKPKTSGVQNYKNNLKMLRSVDPLNYDIGKSSGAKVYARLCQKNKQPVPVDAIDPSHDKSRYLNFWNFTRESEQLFYCPNDKYPLPGFITGHHPQNYCQVCCKKKSNIGKSYTIFQACMEHHTFSKSDEVGNVRYVVNFGKQPERARLGALPDILNKFLVYHLEDINIISDSVSIKTFKFNNRVYSVDKLIKRTRNVKVKMVPIANFHQYLHMPVWKRRRMDQSLIKPIEVLQMEYTAENKIKHRKLYKHYKRIKAADTSVPILVYEHNSRFMIADGLHRLSKAFMDKLSEIPVKFITTKQLNGAFIGKYDLSTASFVSSAPVFGDGDKEPFYYIVGLENYDYTTLSSFSLILGMNNETLIVDILGKLKTHDQIENYSAKELVKKITDHFIGGELSDDNWDRMFYDIIPALYGLTVVVLDLSESMHIITQHNFQDWYVNENYAILLHHGGIYYPIVVAMPYFYYKRTTVEKSIYNYDDHIIRIFESLVKKKKADHDFTLEKVTNFCNKHGYEIVRNFAKNGKIFALEIRDKQLVYVNIEPVKNYAENTGEIILKQYDWNAAMKFLQKYSHEYGVDITINKLYAHGDIYKGYQIGDVVNFVHVKLNAAKMDYVFLKIEQTETWNYDPQILLNITSIVVDPILDEYNEAKNKLNDYAYYKENIIQGKKQEKNKEYETALTQERGNPIKKLLFDKGIYNFKKLYLSKHKNENIYII